MAHPIALDKTMFVLYDNETEGQLCRSIVFINIATVSRITY